MASGTPDTRTRIVRRTCQAVRDFQARLHRDHGVTWGGWARAAELSPATLYGIRDDARKSFLQPDTLEALARGAHRLTGESVRPADILADPALVQAVYGAAPESPAGVPVTGVVTGHRVAPAGATRDGRTQVAPPPGSSDPTQLEALELADDVFAPLHRAGTLLYVLADSDDDPESALGAPCLVELPPDDGAESGNVVVGILARGRGNTYAVTTPQQVPLAQDVKPRRVRRIRHFSHP